jgi:DNA-binding MarR family transcriptional regulator
VQNPEHELDLLEYIARRKESVHQRGLSRSVGLSLGMTNAIVRRLSQKGWLTILKVNNRNIRYAVSPAGIEEIARRSYRYFRRTVSEIVDCRQALERMGRSLKEQGYEEVVLIGASDIDFVVEHACRVVGLRLTRAPAEAAPAQTKAAAGGRFLLYSEMYFVGSRAVGEVGNVAYLQDVVKVRSLTV